MLVIRAGLLINGYGGPPLEDVVVFVEGERIVGVEPAEAAEIPPSAELLDCRAQTLMPGMIDAHVHIELPGGPYAAYAVDEISHIQGYLTLPRLPQRVGHPPGRFYHHTQPEFAGL